MPATNIENDPDRRLAVALQAALLKVFEEILRHRQPPPVLHHYTSPAGFIGILENGQVWATHVLFMNDAHEYREALGVARKVIEELLRGNPDLWTRHLLNEMSRQLLPLESSADNAPLLFVACFTEVDDDLGQWRAYGGEGGISISFRTQDLTRHANSQGALLLPCIYLPSEKIHWVKELVTAMVGVAVSHHATLGLNAPDGGMCARIVSMAFLAVAQLGPMFKNLKFESEKEWRIISTHAQYRQIVAKPKANILSGYIPISISDTTTVTHGDGVKEAGLRQLPLSHVRTGPAEHAALSRLAARAILTRYGYKVPVLPSEVPYRRGT